MQMVDTVGFDVEKHDIKNAFEQLEVNLMIFLKQLP